MSDTHDRHPEVERRIGPAVWPADRPFPLTPVECWYIAQGWMVRPRAEVAMETFLELPGRLEMSHGFIYLRR